MTARAALGAGVAALILVGAPQPAAGHVETRTEGAVTATLSWTGSFGETRDFRLAIDRDGVRVFDDHVRTRSCPRPATRYACLWAGGKRPLELRDLDRDGEPEAIVAGFTGGAHCCLIAIVYRWDGSGYRLAEHNFFDPGYRVVDLDADGRYEFRSADARFGYLYGSFAESVFPIRILAFEGGRFVDVTADFGDAVARNARRTRREYRDRVDSRRRIGLRPALAAYVADLRLLDRRRAAKRTLRRALDRGLLEPQNRFDVGPFGRKFIRDLGRRLRRWGY